MHPNEQLINEFYSAFQKRDYATMQKCYHDKATFNDPAFGDLNSAEVKAMWQMLLSRAKDIKITYRDVHANDTTGKCIWDAWYTFSKTGRQVHNIVEASFELKDNKIFKHRDHFNFWRWSRQALGTPGLFLGWTPTLKKKVSATAREGLQKFMKG